MSLHFDLTDLRLMVSVAEHDSLTAGAQAMGLSLPAASARVRKLEDGAATRLFLRTPQGVTLTPPGQAFVHHARLVLAQLEHLRSDLREYSRGIKGHLRVFANTTALGEFLPPVLRRYLQTHPDVSVDLRERLSHDIVRAVSEGQVDVGIVAGMVRTENLVAIAYRHDRLVLTVASDHDLARRSGVAFADTLEFDQVGLHESSAIHAFLNQICTTLQRPFKPRIQVGNFEAACRMIEAGIGVGIMPGSAARRHAQTMAICAVPLTDDWALRAMQVVVRDLDALAPFARDLVNLLIEDAGSGEPE